MSTPHALPLLDLSPFAADESSPEAQAFVDELREVVHTVGFLYVTGHGVDPELATRIHDVTRAFFALPEADRLEIENVNSPQFRGYTRLRTRGDERPRRPARPDRHQSRGPRPSRLRRRASMAAAPRTEPVAERAAGTPRRRDGLAPATRDTRPARCCGRCRSRSDNAADHFDGGCRPTRGAAQAHPLRHAVDRRLS